MSNDPVTLPIALVGDDYRGPVRRRHEPSLPEPRCGRVDQRAPGRRRPGQRLPPVVLERASGRGLQVARGNERVRAGPRRDAARSPAAPVDGDDIAIICRNTTEAINHLAYRLRLQPDDAVVTTVVEHHANLLPWTRVVPAAVRRVRRRRHVRTRRRRRPRSTPDPERSCWRSPARRTSPAGCRISTASSRPRTLRGVPVFVDAAQLAPHRPLPATPTSSRGAATRCTRPFGAGALVGPRRRVRRGRPVPRRRRRGRPRRPRRSRVDRSART